MICDSAVVLSSSVSCFWGTVASVEETLRSVHHHHANSQNPLYHHG